MTQSLECQIYFDSSRSTVPALTGSVLRDVAHNPEAAATLARLGIRVAEDLPAVLLSEPGGKLRVVGMRLSADEVGKLAAGEKLEPQRPLVLGTGWCPDCARAKRVLADAGIAYDEVDIDRDSKVANELVTRSGGRRVVPTLVIGGRLWAFNPAPPLLRRLLGAAS
jgi:mycoredoxin